MPAFQFSGPTGRMYPEHRDANDDPVGVVEPGDVRELGEPLDADWLAAAPSKGDPERPAESAPKKDWATFAVHSGLCADDDEAAAMTRQQLIELCAPPSTADGRESAEGQLPANATDNTAGAPGEEG